VISPSGQIAEKANFGHAAELLRRRDATAERLRLAREELERVGRAQGLNGEALAQSGRVIKELWIRAIEASIASLKSDRAGSGEKSAESAFPAGRGKKVEDLLREIEKAEASRQLAERTGMELSRLVVGAQINVLRESGSLKALASKYIRAAAAERVGAIDLTNVIESESEVTIRSKRVDQELVIADSLEREAADLDMKRKELDVLYAVMEGIQ
jgi:hypothetical protein